MVCFTAPSDLASNLNARFRISTAGGLGPCGGAIDGEVEDYQFEGLVSILEVPTMGQWGIGVLILLLAFVGIRRMAV